MENLKFISEAEHILSSLYGVQNFHTSIIQHGVMAHKVLAEHEKTGQLIVRLYPTTRSHVVDFEPDLIRHLSSIGIKVAEVIADSRSGPKSSMSYMVYRMVKGETLQSRLHALTARQLHRIGSEIVELVSKLGELPISGFGDLVDAQTAECSSSKEFVENSFSIDFYEAHARGLISLDWASRLTFLGKWLDRFYLPHEPALAWGDLSPENIIMDDQCRIAGFIDFEGVVSCEPLLTFGFYQARYLDSSLGATISKLWPQNERGSASVAFYSVLRAVRILKYSQSPLPTGIQRSPINELLPGVGRALTSLCLP